MIYAGAAFEYSLTFNDPSGAVIDLSATPLRVQIKPTQAGLVLLELTTANGKLRIDPANPASIIMRMEAADTAALLPPGTPQGQVWFTLCALDSMTHMLDGTFTTSA